MQWASEAALVASVLVAVVEVAVAVVVAEGASARRMNRQPSNSSNGNRHAWGGGNDAVPGEVAPGRLAATAPSGWGEKGTSSRQGQCWLDDVCNRAQLPRGQAESFE